jgi:hypothetical protein
MSYDNLSSVSQNVLKFYQQLPLMRSLTTMCYNHNNKRNAFLDTIERGPQYSSRNHV